MRAGTQQQRCRCSASGGAPLPPQLQMRRSTPKRLLPLLSDYVAAQVWPPLLNTYPPVGFLGAMPPERTWLETPRTHLFSDPCARLPPIAGHAHAL